MCQRCPKNKAEFVEDCHSSGDEVNLSLMNDSSRYDQWIESQNAAWEAKCTRCGACCGSIDDPCENLRKDSNGKYDCAVYDRRFGKWHTVSGKELTCVPLREKLARGESWPGDEHCGYKKSF